jgi:hypothetical protein
MTDWERVAKLRTKGVSWEVVARDEKVGFHPPDGSNDGRALKAIYYRRKSNTSRSHQVRPGTPSKRKALYATGIAPRTRWAIGGIALAGFAVIILVIVFVFPSTGPQSPATTPGPGSAGSETEFNYLSQQHSDRCHWPDVNLGDETANVNWINGLPDGVYLQGACCSPMDVPDYSNQTSSLKAYVSQSSIISLDPYNMPSSVAKADVAGENLALSAEQQTTLSTAAGLTNDHGWCCCQCWAYYAHEGLAKTLIVQNGYNAQQVGTVINLEDCCGGPGQMNM